MSHDLFLAPRTGAPDHAAMLRWFAARPHYEAEDTQILYDNPETGVHYMIDLTGGIDPDDSDAIAYPIHVNTNYFRPSFFIEEVEPEVTAFAQAFDLVALDPQTDGMGEGDYDGMKFRSGWHAGNKFAHDSIARRPSSQPLHSLPRERLLAAWRWNANKASLQASIGPSVFVPRVMLGVLDGRTITLSVWSDGIPTVFTPVDYVIVRRDELAPKRFLRRRAPDSVLAAWSDVQRAITPHARHEGEGWRPTYDATPSDIAAFVRKLTTSVDDLVILHPGTVLDEEMLTLPSV